MAQRKKMKVEASTSKPSDPDYIKFLFNANFDHGCYLVVGNPSLAPVAKIGVVKEMLFAHSSVMRSDLQVKDIKEKVPIKIQDIFPETFRILLRFVYGFDTTSTLSFDDADNLLYAAEKYNILSLKNKVAVRLQSLLSPDNICILMNNKVCYETLGLNSQINKILQFETTKVFASPHFLELTSDAFVKLLEQEMLNVKEVEVWRNAIKWAKHKAKRGDGKSLRKELGEPLKHLRVCSLPLEEFCSEVVPTKVLLDHEISEVCLAVGTNKTQANLTEVCNKVQKRARPFVKSEARKLILSNSASSQHLIQGSFTIQTYDLRIEILSVTLNMSSGNGEAFKVLFEVERVATQEVGVANPRNRACVGNPPTKMAITHTVFHQNRGLLTIPVAKEVHLLLPRNEYKINISCDRHFDGYSYNDGYGYVGYALQESKDFKVMPNSYLPIKQIEYKTLTLPT